MNGRQRSILVVVGALLALSLLYAPWQARINRERITPAGPFVLVGVDTGSFEFIGWQLIFDVFGFRDEMLPPPADSFKKYEAVDLCWPLLIVEWVALGVLLALGLWWFKTHSQKLVDQGAPS